MTIRHLRLADDDNVFVLLENAEPGDDLAGIPVHGDVPILAGHKVACRPIPERTPIVKYGQQIGLAATDIKPGAHVHTHNVVVHEFDREHSSGPVSTVASVAVPETFEGVLREDGRAATRNYVGIVTSVNCSATVAKMIARNVESDVDAMPAIDGIVPVTHGFGCCQGADEPGMQQLMRTLTGMASHPNFAAVLVLGLGCETNQVSRMLAEAGLDESERLRTLSIQDAGGTRATVDRASEVLREMLPLASVFDRRPIPASKLMLGLECGGSDGYSGLSANPALGKAVDRLVAIGGTAVLSETPEIYGAEHLLLKRAASEEVADKLRELIRWWKRYAEINGSKLDNNPTFGNKAGGLTTIYEKSLGAVAKGGSTSLNEVYRYAERIDTSGLVFMDSPGYDPMSITGQVAGGANLVAFTTGRGSVYGCRPTPSLKLATNSPIYERMRDDMDINCGPVVDGGVSVDEMGDVIFAALLETASGRRTKSEKLGFGVDEFVPWIVGAQM